MSSTTAPKTLVGKAIGPTGYGLMGLTRPWDQIDFSESVKLMKTALEQGANFWNGGIHYGTPDRNSLHLLKHYFEQYPEDADKVVLSIKGAYDAKTHIPDGTPEGIRASVEEAVRVLDGVKKIDIFECARVDPNVPIETSVQALAGLIKEGKIGGIGLSEVSAATIRRAHVVHPIDSVEIELSIFTPDAVTNGVTEACQELGIALVAYSPVSRGLLTGEFRKPEDLPANDMRHMLPRFKADVFTQNFKLVEAVEKIAQRKGANVAQVAIAWVRRQGAIPIPGSTKAERVVQNCEDVQLSDDDLKEIWALIESLPVAGQRYGGKFEQYLNQ
ncbi:Pyridoxal reductase [Colletotrichum aenigma]|uniref:Pyridoxal reductase n=1 Tax=Colletotrichum aenigma TaxID=1215731 RepID=UPI001872D8EF|nr:Pyridoxal reductase [Colletotrichum aenigma]KAF5528008.1 Pyridoxal reductase [Colletotrichum aenigma]